MNDYKITMINNRRFKKVLLSQPLIIKNKFRHSGYKRPKTKILKAPLPITSLEGAQQFQMQKELANMFRNGDIAKLKQSNLLGENDDLDINDFMTEEVLLPTGVSSIQDAIKERNKERAAERFNAGILDEDQQKNKAFYKAAKKHQLNEYRNKIIRYLATSEDIEEVPREFREEVEAYYADPANNMTPAQIDEIKRKRETKKQQKESKLMSKIKAMNDIIKEQDKYKMYRPTITQLDVNKMTDNLQGHGWKAPMLHTLVRPYTSFSTGEKLSKIIDDENDDLEKRRELYKNYQTLQRGKEPPKNMIERAMPKLVKPITIEDDYETTNDVILHPFVFPQKKYCFQVWS